MMPAADRVVAELGNAFASIGFWHKSKGQKTKIIGQRATFSQTILSLSSELNALRLPSECLIFDK